VDLKFDHIQNLHLLWGVALLAGVYVYGFYRKARAMNAFATGNLFNELMPRLSVGRQKFRAAMVLLAMVLLVLASAGPRWGREIVDLQRKGIDLIVCLDVSRSMLAEDIAPNRLERAKLELSDMLGEMHGDRVGLVTFAGTAAATCPLTINYGSYRMSLDEVDTQSAARGGSLIGDAVRVAAGSFTDKIKGHKAILLITDGEDQESFPVEAAATAFREHGIRVFTVGFGDIGEGTRIPVTINDQKRFIEHDGQEVWSKLDESVLREMAVEGGGSYFPVRTTDANFSEVYEHIRSKIEAREFETSRKERYNAQFHWFAGAALFFLFLEWMLTDRGPDRRLATRIRSGV
jgi:Ca-activated chloride channel family protein